MRNYAKSLSNTSDLVTAREIGTQCVIAGFRRGVNEGVPLLECYTVQVGSYWLFGLPEDRTDRLSRNVDN